MAALGGPSAGAVRVDVVEPKPASAVEVKAELAACRQMLQRAEARAQGLEQDLERYKQERAQLLAFLRTVQQAERHCSKVLIDGLELAKPQAPAQEEEEDGAEPGKAPETEAEAAKEILIYCFAGVGWVVFVMKVAGWLFS
ncbi:hypothetical protein HYH03_016848 [Edaphochlamys debaryana]|uniref:Uncharacterized protein n=1 Tax=Edaphochlamys debaryana TaxID=47281 RepID=A0A836BR55_9CHLO|nr:hypothetical protein HYH03_016848 [Edaphochlamys debaryana]|eukprot:KAG2484303.1 hypothetical protein HYH03_016848 [Edaphochlamys debaryana]